MLVPLDADVVNVSALLRFGSLLSRTLTRQALLKWCDYGSLRATAFATGFHNKQTRANAALLEQLAGKRRQLAKLLGFESFAHLTLADSVMQAS